MLLRDVDLRTGTRKRPAAHENGNENETFHRTRDLQSAPPSTTARPLFVKDLRQHNGAKK